MRPIGSGLPGENGDSRLAPLAEAAHELARANLAEAREALARGDRRAFSGHLARADRAIGILLDLVHPTRALVSARW